MSMPPRVPRVPSCRLSGCHPGVGVPVLCWGAGRVLGVLAKCRGVRVLGCGSGVGVRSDVKVLAWCQGAGWVAPAVMAVLALALVSLRSAGATH